MKFLKSGSDILFKCPGCIGPQRIPVEGQNAWGFNGDLNSPTLTPSILARRSNGTGLYFVCHSFVKEGKIEFLNDCTHSLKGQTVDLPDIENESDLFYRNQAGEAE